MNEDGEAAANDLASECKSDRKRQKIRRDLAQFRRRLQERVKTFASHFSFIFIVFAYENN